MEHPKGLSGAQDIGQARPTGLAEALAHSRVCTQLECEQIHWVCSIRTHLWLRSSDNPVCVGTSEYAGVQEYAEAARDMVTHAHDAIIVSRVEQTHYANTRRRLDEVNLETGQKAYLSTENLNLPKA